MGAVELRADLSQLVDALVSGNKEHIIASVRDHLRQNEAPDVLIGRIGLIAAQGDSEGHVVATLGAAAILCRYLHFVPQPLEPDALDNREYDNWSRALPLFAEAMLAAIPAVQAGYDAPEKYPEPYFPSALMDTGKSVREVMQDAVLKGDTQLVERIIFGLYGTGADYRTMQVRTYDGIATTFQDGGHPLTLAVRGLKNLDAVEWGDRAPRIIHWLAPHLTLKKETQEPAWVNTVRNFVSEHHDGLARLRVRITTPHDEDALPLRELPLTNTDAGQLCQAVYDALLKGEASPAGVCSVIALAAADMLLRIPENDQATFTRVAHGLLYSAATRTAIHQSRQDDDVLSLIFFSAAYVNAIQRDLAAQKGQTQAATTSEVATIYKGGGFIGVTQLENLREELSKNDFASAYNTARRYLQLGHDPRALFGSIGLVAAQIDATAEQGHALQIVQAVSEEFISWPRSLKKTSIDAFVQVALRAAITGPRDPLITGL
jgi:hypothetical protein